LVTKNISEENPRLHLYVVDTRIIQNASLKL